MKNNQVSFFFVRFPTCLIASNLISDKAQCLLLYLMRCEVQNWRPTFGQIAKSIRAGNDTVSRTLGELELLGIIEIRGGKNHRVGKSLKKEKNDYTINWDISQWRPTPKLKQRLIDECRKLGFPEPTFQKEFQSEIEFYALVGKLYKPKNNSTEVNPKPIKPKETEIPDAVKTWTDFVDHENPMAVAIQVFELISGGGLSGEEQSFFETMRVRLLKRLENQPSDHNPQNQNNFALSMILKRPQSPKQILAAIMELKNRPPQNFQSI